MPIINTARETVPFERLKIAIEGINYIVVLEWNMRSGWYLGLRDASNAVIFSPKKLTCNTNLLRSVTDARKPSGVLGVIDLAGLDREPGYDALTTTHRIVHMSNAELAELLGV